MGLERNVVRGIIRKLTKMERMIFFTIKTRVIKAKRKTLRLPPHHLHHRHRLRPDERRKNHQ